jgi:hypothetical protein
MTLHFLPPTAKRIQGKSAENARCRPTLIFKRNALEWCGGCDRNVREKRFCVYFSLPGELLFALLESRVCRRVGVIKSAASGCAVKKCSEKKDANLIDTLHGRVIKMQNVG